jgi:hypothetical protein
MGNNYLSDSTSVWTEEEWREHTYVYCYTVFWKEKRNLTSTMWYQKPFASKKEAKAFAKKKKDKSIKLKPYILKTVVHGNYFRKDVEVERAYGCGMYEYVEVIKV